MQHIRTLSICRTIIRETCIESIRFTALRLLLLLSRNVNFDDTSIGIYDFAVIPAGGFVSDNSPPLIVAGDLVEMTLLVTATGAVGDGTSFFSAGAAAIQLIVPSNLP